MYKLIIFDLDGTLLDTLPDIYTVLNDTLRKFNLKEVTLENVKAFVGNGAKTLVKRAVGDSPKFEDVYYDYAANFAENGNERTALFNGETEVLSALKNLGVKLAVITNKPQKATDRVIDKFFKNYGFDFVIGQSENNPLKPDPASTLKIINELHLEKKECLFVGDGETDFQTAQNAGINCISVLWGYRSRQELEKVGANCFALDWKALYELLIKEIIS